jgi:hypothetical protein
MIEQVAARNSLASETVAAVIERTSGVPWFVEELTRSVLESCARLSGREIFLLAARCRASGIPMRRYSGRCG